MMVAAGAAGLAGVVGAGMETAATPGNLVLGLVLVVLGGIDTMAASALAMVKMGIVLAE